MNRIGISIIIPCFNCANTLEQAFDSCFSQCTPGSIEVVMVDDFSTDETRDVMRRLATGRNNVKLFYHKQNMGGGATRNTAVRNASSDVIFCLDSDDILPNGSIGKMYTLLKEKNADGVGIHRSIKFNGNNTNNISHVNVFGYLGMKIPFESLMERPSGPFCPLYSTFMFTKEAFEIAGGYPENHGFDTQSFAWKFLANGLTAYTCKDAEYLHRIHYNKSYYVREYEDGKINHNWFKIFEEFLYLFNDETQREILSLNLNDPNESIFNKINAKANIFKDNYATLLKHDSELKYEKYLTDKIDIPAGDMYWLAVRKYDQKKYAEAFALFETMIGSGLNNGYAHLYLKNASSMLGKPSLLIDENVIEKNFAFRKQGSQVNIFTRIYRKTRKEIKGRLNKINIISKYYYRFVGIRNNIYQYFTEKSEYLRYREDIEEIIRRKEIVIQLDWGGLGDVLAYTLLPRTLGKKYGINFYLSERSRHIFRNSDILKLCFEMNPYFRGFKNQVGFKYKTFSREKPASELLLDIHGKNIMQNLNDQFDIGGPAIPQIYYTPHLIPEYRDTILIDVNFISGHKLGWVYDIKQIENYVKHISCDKYRVEYIDPVKQDIFRYADMIHSSHKFVTVLSGGAALAAALHTKAIVFLPKNVRGGSVYNFTFENSSVTYIP